MSIYDTLLNFSKMEEIGAAEELNQEISETSKEWVLTIIFDKYFQ